MFINGLALATKFPVQIAYYQALITIFEVHSFNEEHLITIIRTLCIISKTTDKLAFLYK